MNFTVKYSALAILLTQYAYATEAEMEIEELQARSDSSAKLYAFNARSLFGGASQDIDLSNFKRSNGVIPGVYTLQTTINGEKTLGLIDFKFDHLDASRTAVLCIDKQLLSRLDLKREILENLPKQDCLTIKDLSADAYYDVNMSDLTLNISLPLVIVNQRPHGYIAPEQFDKGVTSAFVSYDFNRYTSKTHQQKELSSNYLSLTGGLNLGGLSFRHAGSFDSSGTGLGSYHSYMNAISTDVLPLHARLTAGDFSTQSYVTESAQIRGMQLASDISMLPMSQRSYAPLIKGVANTNALVSIYQNGRKIYERTVPVGEFEFNDLTAIGNNGDLTVEVTENGGEKRQFIVPMQGNMSLVRVGQFNYSMAVGQYKLNNIVTDDYVAQFGAEFGLTNYSSVSAAINASKVYQNYVLSLGKNTSLGGFRFDLEQAKTTVIQKDYMGQRFKLAYQYSHAPSNLSISATAQYQDQKYQTLNNTMLLLNYKDLGQVELDNLFSSYRLKQQFNLSLYKTFANSKLGSISLSVLKSNYWDSMDDYMQYDLGYANRWNKLNYSIGYSQSNRSLSGYNSNNKDQKVYLTLSMPLEWRKKHINTYSNIQHSKTEGQPTNATLGFTGTLGEQKQMNYSVTANQSWNQNSAENSSISTNLSYNLPQVKFGVMVSSSDQQSQYSVSARGALVAHRYGITATNQISDTYTIIHAEGARGANIMNAWGSKIDYFGNAVYANLSPYDKNLISLNIQDLDFDINVKSNQAEVIPRRNSATLVKFDVEKTSNILLNVLNFDMTKQIPIGVQALSTDGQIVGMFGQSNQLFIEKAALLNQDILVQWGATERQACRINAPQRVLSKQKNTKKMQLIDVECK
ncbi:thin pili usher protein AcuC [Acinetobacter guillouiae]|uniref:fimbria/pilus outer membrane usher protein n=1 Tax=Acinetobacter guillouiae TaxID=106649 RepID=UPI0004EF63EE|nr:fimbria/pilus outer membrane usher protein [Acinetobacter guillouiae]BAP36417.1 thin pili usher protein AcuC [Acinetobacter guillouiae]